LTIARRAPRVVLHFFFSSRRRHTRWPRDWSSDVCSSDLTCLDLRSPVLPSPRGHDGQHERWWLHEFTPRKGYVATLAAPIPKPRLRYWEWQADDLDNAIQFAPSQDQQDQSGSGPQRPTTSTL